MTHIEQIQNLQSGKLVSISTIQQEVGISALCDKWISESLRAQR
jgi:hypothetical protein